MKYLLLAFLVACVPTTPIPDYPTPTITPTASCQINGALPDPRCTPGELNSNVTQTNIGQTICVPGWTGTIRPPVSKTNAWKRIVARNYGITNFDATQYEGDHYVPLGVGGYPGADGDYKNFWDEPRFGSLNAADKDRVELWVHTMVCNGTMSLADGQAIFLIGKWTQYVKIAETFAPVGDPDDEQTTDTRDIGIAVLAWILGLTLLFMFYLWTVDRHRGH